MAVLITFTMKTDVVWESAEDQQRFMSMPGAAEMMAERGMPIPTDLKVTPLISVYLP